MRHDWWRFIRHYQASILFGVGVLVGAAVAVRWGRSGYLLVALDVVFVGWRVWRRSREREEMTDNGD